MEEYKRALSEVNIIINNLPKELEMKIPYKFKQIVEQEKDNNYKPDINNLVIQDDMLQETKIILGLIYRDFLCDEQEKQKLQIRDKEQEKVIEEEKYDYNNLFKKKVKREKEEMALVEVKQKWYTKIIEFFKRKIRGE